MTRPPFPLFLRRRADRLAEQGRWDQAYETMVQAAHAYEYGRSRKLSAHCWARAALAAKALGHRGEQIQHARRALALVEHEGLTRMVRGIRVMALNQLADGLSSANDLSGAARAAREAVALTDGWDRGLHLAAARGLGQILARQGVIGEALTVLAHNVGVARELGDRLDIAQALLDLGNVAVHAGDAATAQAAGEEARRLATGSREPDHETVLADALLLCSRVAREAGRHPEAVALARESMWLVSTTGQTGRLTEQRTVLANNLMYKGETDEAISLMTQSYHEAERRTDLGRLALAAGNLASAHAVAGDFDAARLWAERSLAAVRDATDRESTAPALTVLAKIRHLQGDDAGAEAALQRAVELFEETRSTARDEIEHVELLTRQGEVYRLLQRCGLERGDSDGALEAALRVRGLLLAQQRVAGGGGPEVAAPTATPARLSAAAARHGAVILVYSLPGPPLFTFGSRSPSVHIWAITPDGARRHVETSLAALHELTDAAAASAQASGPAEAQALEHLASTARDSRLTTVRPDLTGPALRALAAAFLHPVEEALRSARRLIVLPDDYVNLLPFHALPLADGTALAERCPVSLAPSALSLTAADVPGTPVTPDQALVVGNPEPPIEPLLPGLAPFAPADLPDAEREARETAVLYGAEPLLGARASCEEVLRRLPHSRFAHFATHALAGHDVLRIPGALCLAKAYLRVDDIRPLDLSECRLVVLSACETGWGRFTPEGNVGLARAFLAAGADCVVMSLWAVHDTPTADLMIAMHRLLAGGATAGEALRGAMLKTRARHPDPVDWAGFALVGNPEVRLPAVASER